MLFFFFLLIGNFVKSCKYTVSIEKKLYFALSLDIVLWKLLMKQFFANENMISGNNETIEICMNDVVLEGKIEENSSVQT